MPSYRTIRVANPVKMPRSTAAILKAISGGYVQPAKERVQHRTKCVGGQKMRVKYGRGSTKGTFTLVPTKNPRYRRRNQNILTDALVGQISEGVASKVGRMFAATRGKKTRTRARRRRGRNPHLALIGANPKRKRRGTTMARRRRRTRRNTPARNAKGRFVKASRRRNRTRKSVVVVNRSRKRKRVRRRRANKPRVVIRYRTRRVANVARRRRRKSVRRRSRRRNMAALAAVNPRRRRRRSTRTRVRSRRRNVGRARRYNRRRRRNAGLGGLIGRVNLMQVAEVAGGVFIGDKITGYVAPMITNAIGIVDPTTSGLVKTGLGIVTAGLVWRFRPALGLGIAVGAANALLNQYVFGPLWGFATPYLPTGMAGLADYQARGWKMDDWLYQGAGGAGVAGMGQNKLLTKGL